MFLSFLESRKRRYLDLSARGIDLSPGELLLDSYEVVGLVGRGGMGAVYRVYHRYLKKVMAMKTLNETHGSNVSWRRFQAEAQAIARLEHPNIVQIYDMGALESGQLYYTMEFLRGKGLDSFIAQGQLTVEQILTIFCSVACALAFAHERGIIHRDVKPANIMVVIQDERPPLVKVVDFGIAKLLTSEQGLTRTGEIFGSPFYMSPEQARGEKVDARSDVYSLGCALYEALTGCVPLKGKNAMDTLTLHQQRMPLPISDLCPGRVFPLGLWEVLQRMMAKAPEERYESVSQIAQDLLLVNQGAGARVSARLQKQREEARALSSAPGTEVGSSFSGEWPLRNIASAGRGLSGTISSANLLYKNATGQNESQSQDSQSLSGTAGIANLVGRPIVIAALIFGLLALWGWGRTFFSLQALALVQHFGFYPKLNQFDALYAKLDHYKLESSQLVSLAVLPSGNQQFDYYLFPTSSTFAIGRIASRLTQSQDDFANDCPCIGLQKVPAGSKLQLIMSPYMAWHLELFQRFNAGDLIAVCFPYQQKTRTKNLPTVSFPSYKDSSETLKLINTLKPFTTLSCLNTADAQLDEKCLRELLYFSDLSQLDMTGSSIVFEPDKLRLRHLLKLNTLNLPAVSRVDVILNSLVVPQSLTSLTIDEFVCTEDNLKAIARLKKLGYLACLDSRIEPCFLSELLRLDCLVRLNFSGSYLPPESIPLLLKMKKTQSLVLSGGIEQVWGTEKFASFRKEFPGILETTSTRIEPFLAGN